MQQSQRFKNADRLMYVVGATRPEVFKDVREVVPEAFLLVPGVGAQGGTVEEVAQHGMNDRCGLLVNSSRGILYAGGKEASQEVSFGQLFVWLRIWQPKWAQRCRNATSFEELAKFTSTFVKRDAVQGSRLVLTL